MPYITSIERMAREEGRKEGREEGREENRIALRRLHIDHVCSILKQRFGPLPQAVKTFIEDADSTALSALFDRALKVADLSEFLHQDA